jgi:hypothetical protein
MVKATVGSKAPIAEPKRGKGKASAPAATEETISLILFWSTG